jgi:hypothetical protein
MLSTLHRTGRRGQTINERGGAHQHTRPLNSALINEAKGIMKMSVITRSEVPVIDSINSGWPSLDGTPLTYSLLRHVLVDSGVMDERDGQKLDRAVGRLLDT